MAIYAIGDIHGCIGALKRQFDLNDFTPDDTLVFLGDYVDRGPNVRGTIDFLLAQSRRLNIIFLKGNHEIMMEEARLAPDLFSFWHVNGGRETLASYGTGVGSDWSDHVPLLHWNFFTSTRPFYQIDNWHFVHAALEPGVALAEQRPDHLFWKKIQLEPEPFSDSAVVICGHTAQKSGHIADWGHTLCIDTHAYAGRWLTCLNCTDMTYVQTSELGTARRGALRQ